MHNRQCQPVFCLVFIGPRLGRLPCTILDEFSENFQSFRLYSLGPLCLRQCLWLMWGRAMVCSRWFRTLKSFLLAGSACTVPFNGDKKLSCPFIRQLKKLKCESRPKKTKFYRLEQEYPIFSEGSSL